jgi:dihydroorotate dehydrogenase (NAD+) catalytic subunit
MNATPRLATTICGIPLENPIIAASGTFAYGVEFADIIDLNRLGGFVVKGLSREPIEGNKPPRLWETASGMMNSIGLQNIGVKEFIRTKLPALTGFRAKVIANVFGYAPEDYYEVVRILNDAPGIAAYELNVSCPNTKHGGIFFSADPALLTSLVSEIRKLSQRPLIVKLSPNVAKIRRPEPTLSLLSIR